MRISLVGLAALLAISTNSYSQDLSGRWGLGAGLGASIPTGNALFKSSASTGAAFGLWVRNHFGPSLGFEGSYDHLGFSNVSTEVHDFQLSLFWRTSGLADLSPILQGGLGFATVPGFPGYTAGTHADAQFSVKLRAGLEYQLSDAFAMAAHLNYFFINGRANTTVHDIGPMAALTYYFPAQASAPILKAEPQAGQAVVVVADADSDGDGVLDKDDRCPSTAKNLAVNGYGCTATEKVSIRLEILFANNKAIIPNQFHEEVTKLALFMKQYKDTSVEIAGFTDNTGNAKANTKLSQARADAIRYELVNYYSIASGRIKAVGYGPSHPIASNKTEAGRRKNRRVVAEVTATKAAQ